MKHFPEPPHDLGARKSNAIGVQRPHRMIFAVFENPRIGRVDGVAFADPEQLGFVPFINHQADEVVFLGSALSLPFVPGDEPVEVFDELAVRGVEGVAAPAHHLEVANIQIERDLIEPWLQLDMLQCPLKGAVAFEEGSESLHFGFIPWADAIGILSVNHFSLLMIVHKEKGSHRHDGSQVI